MNARLNAEEGVEYKVYRDTKGNPTGGRGHLLNAAEKTMYPVGAALTSGQVNAWAVDDLKEAQDSLARMMSTRFSFDVAALPDTVWEALVDLCFNMGASNLAGYVNTIRLIILGRYADAAAHLLENKAWVETVHEARANAIADLIREAKYYPA